MHLITGYSGSAHITSANDGEINAHVFGTGSYVFNSRERFEANVVSNNEIAIGSGEGLFNGRYFEIANGTHDTANIDNGVAGTNRIDLIVARYQKNAETGIETMQIYVIKGTNADSPVVPSYETGNILDGVGIADFPLYKVIINGITINAVEQLFTVRDDIVSEVKSDNERTLESVKQENELTRQAIHALDGMLKIKVEENCSFPGSHEMPIEFLDCDYILITHNNASVVAFAKLEKGTEQIIWCKNMDYVIYNDEVENHLINFFLSINGRNIQMTRYDKTVFLTMANVNPYDTKSYYNNNPGSFMLNIYGLEAVK